MTEKPSGSTGVEGEYHLFLSAAHSRQNCSYCGKQTNFKLFDGYFREIDWCCNECYEQKYGPKRKKT